MRVIVLKMLIRILSAPPTQNFLIKFGLITKTLISIIVGRVNIFLVMMKNKFYICGFLNTSSLKQF